MRKGDEKKQELMLTAEQLFCRRGYRETSVQDILDVLHTSKGSFYHHFDSKDQLLQELCARRAEATATAVAAAVIDMAPGTMKRLNTVLTGFIPLQSRNLEFMAMLMPILFTAEGKAISAVYQEALTTSFMPMLAHELADASKAGLICTPGTTPITPAVCALLNRCWLTAAQYMHQTLQNSGSAEATELLDELNMTRCVLERLLDAPFGSIELLSMEDWYETRKLIAQVVRA